MWRTLCANLNSIILDFVARTKIHGNHLNKYILDQLPLIPPETYESTYIGFRSALEIAREAVIALTYTAHDMASFAQDLNYVDAQGKVLPRLFGIFGSEQSAWHNLTPCIVFFMAFIITKIYDTFIQRFRLLSEKTMKTWGGYLSRDLCLM